MTKKRSKIKIKKSREGALLRWCNRHGYASANRKTVTVACIRAALRSKDPRVRKMGNFARNARGWAKGKK